MANNGDINGNIVIANLLEKYHDNETGYDLRA